MTKTIALTAIALVLWCSDSAKAQLPSGTRMEHVKLIGGDGKETPIPFLGEKVLLVLYTDPDVKDVNDPLSEAVKLRFTDKTKYQGIGVINCKDSWIPNAALKIAAQKKEKQFPGSIILLDKTHVIAKSLNLGDCNEQGIVLLVGKNKEILFSKRCKNQEDSKAIIDKVIALMEKELGK